MLKVQEIKTDLAPKALGPYSQAIKTDNLVFVSGQLPIDSSTGKIVEGGIAEQTLKVLENIEAILQAAGLSLKHVVRTDIFMQDLKDFEAMNAVYGGFFSYPIKPARQTIQVAKLPREALIEISCIAVLS